MVPSDSKAIGSYRFHVANAPTSPAGPRPAILFLHGWQGSSNNIIGTKALRRFADEIGAVLIAPQGIRTSWSYPGSPLQARDEFAYFDALRRAIIERHNVDPERILVSGFSMGASMAWNLACEQGENYWGFIAFSGAFWAPLPKRCASPARRMIHIHGEADRTVPIKGRPIGLSWRQGDADKSMRVLLSSSALRKTREGVTRLAGMDCQRWGGAGRLAQFCRHKGGHLWRAQWLRAAYRVLAAR